VFNDNVEQKYESFDKIFALNNYNEITHLDCHYNNLTSLPEFPESLKYLYCYGNNLTSLPELPKSLINLNCSYNNLTSLPELPESLKYLHCPYNKLTCLPKFPESLTHLWCHNNNLTSLPELPKSLIWLNCSDNNNNFPDQLKKLSQETMEEYIKRYNEYYYNYNAIKITHFFKNVVLAQKRAIQILLAKSVENFYYSPDCKVMMKIREKQWQKQWKKHFK